MTIVDDDRIAQEKMRSARNLADSEKDGRMVAAGFWRGRMEAFAEVDKGRWAVNGDGPLHDGVPPDLNTDADPPSRPGTAGTVAAVTVMVVILVALVLGLYEIGALIIAALPL